LGTATRRAAIALGLAAADRAAPGTTVSLTVEPAPNGFRLRAGAPATEAAAGPGLALARRWSRCFPPAGPRRIAPLGA
jgi:hypothetical protein